MDFPQLRKGLSRADSRKLVNKMNSKGKKRGAFTKREKRRLDLGLRIGAGKQIRQVVERAGGVGA